MSKVISDKNINIDVMDPLVYFDNLNKGQVIKEKFTKDTNVENYDLIIGYNPCGATETVIRKSIEENKEFCIFLCGCCFLPENYTERTPENWHKYLYEIAKELA